MVDFIYFVKFNVKSHSYFLTYGAKRVYQYEGNSKNCLDDIDLKDNKVEAPQCLYIYDIDWENSHFNILTTDNKSKSNHKEIYSSKVVSV